MQKSRQRKCQMAPCAMQDLNQGNLMERAWVERKLLGGGQGATPQAAGSQSRQVVGILEEGRENQCDWSTRQGGGWWKESLE